MNKENSQKYTEIIVKAMEDRKAKQIEVIDISEKTPITDAFILCSGTSSTHLRGIADEVEEKMKQNGVVCAHLEGYDTARWILLDFIDVVVHIFLEEERQFYNIERLWRYKRSTDKKAAVLAPPQLTVYDEVRRGRGSVVRVFHFYGALRGFVDRFGVVERFHRLFERGFDRGIVAGVNSLAQYIQFFGQLRF